MLCLLSLLFLELAKFDSIDSDLFRKQQKEMYTDTLFLENGVVNDKSFMVGYDENQLIIGNIDENFELLTYNRNNHNSVVIYQSEDNVTIVYDNYCDGKIWLGEVISSEKMNLFTLKCIDLYGNEKIVIEENITKIPYISYDSHNLFVNMIEHRSNKFISSLISIDAYSYDKVLIDYKECEIRENDKLYGEMIMYCGGMDEIIYYQTIKLNGTVLELANKCDVISYNMNTKKKSIIKELNHILQYINGNKDYLFLSKYSYDDAFVNTGYIVRLSDNNCQYLNGIDPVYDMIGCNKIDENKLLLYTTKDMFVFDMKNRNYYQNTYTHKNEIVSSVKYYKNSLGFLVYNSNNVSFRTIKF